MIALLALLGCQPAGQETRSPRCVAEPPPPGEVVIGPLACDAMRLAGGEARSSDVWLANHWLRATVRHPESALGVPGVGGGTVIDAAPWGYRDRLHEAVPVVDGGWLDVDTFEVEADRVVVAGFVAPLPLGPAVPDGRREVAWVPDPDGPWLRLEGADGLWIRPAGGLELLDGMLVGDLTYAYDGALAQDLGGAIRVEGGTGLVVAPSASAPAEWTETRRIAGTADADTVVLARDGEVVGRIPVDGAFDWWVQSDVDAVRAEARGRAPGPWVEPGTDLTLAAGATGTIGMRITGPEAVEVAWTDAAGRSGTAGVRSLDGRLGLGAGSYDLRVSAGPAWGTASRGVSVRAGETVDLEMALPPRFDPGARVLADLSGAGSRSWTWRGTDAQALRAEAARGRGFVVVAPEDDVAAATADAVTADLLRWRNGVRLGSRRGFSIVAWPWTATATGGGHGAVDLADLDAADALAAATGGPGTSRFTVVDTSWLAQAGPPWTLDPRPDFVLLDAPGPLGPASGAWDDWAAWLDAGVALVPVGPLVWVGVDDPDAYAGVDVEQGLVRGHVVATTGGLVEFQVDGTEPGEVVHPRRPPPEAPLERIAQVRVSAADVPFARAALIRDGEVIAEWGVEDRVAVAVPIAPGGRWIAAAAWSADGEGWAVTGPVWLGPP